MLREAAGTAAGSSSRVEKVLAPARVTKTAGTGWNLAGDEIAFGRCGLVGDRWRELSVTFEFDSPGGVAVSAEGDCVIVTDCGNGRFHIYREAEP